MYTYVLCIPMASTFSKNNLPEPERQGQIILLKVHSLWYLTGLKNAPIVLTELVFVGLTIVL